MERNKKILKMTENLESLAMDGLFNHDDVQKTDRDYIGVFQDVEEEYETLGRKGFDVSEKLENLRYNILLHSRWNIVEDIRRMGDDDFGDLIYNRDVGNIDFDSKKFVYYTQLIGEYLSKLQRGLLKDG